MSAWKSKTKQKCGTWRAGHQSEMRLQLPGALTDVCLLADPHPHCYCVFARIPEPSNRILSYIRGAKPTADAMRLRRTAAGWIFDPPFPARTVRMTSLIHFGDNSTGSRLLQSSLKLAGVLPFLQQTLEKASCRVRCKRVPPLLAHDCGTSLHPAASLAGTKA